MTLTAAEVWRDYELDGVPASGPYSPEKSNIRSWGALLEQLLGSGAAGLAYATLAALGADLAHPANTTAIVYGDATAANNGLYVKSGASGSGAWQRIGDLPGDIIRLTVTGGTGNAIIATAPETPSMPGNKLYLMTPSANNTNATTIVVNGAPAVSIKNAFGSTLANGSLVIGSPVLMAWQVDHYQLLISAVVDGSAILADTVSARNDAQTAATSASTSAAALGNQVHQYDSRAQAIAATIPAGIAYVKTMEFAAGSGGGGLFKRGVAIVATGADFRSADGAFWNLVEKQINVRQFGAKGDVATDDTTAIQNALNAASSNNGMVYLPSGNYKVTSTLTIAGEVSLIGDGVGATAITGTGDILVLNFTGNGNMERIFAVGYQNASATNFCVQTAINGRNFFRDCFIWGGLYGLNSRGVDGCFENCFIAGAATAGGHLSSSGANWYIRCKFDDIGFTVGRGAVIAGSGGIIENHFMQCDFSGSFPSGSLLIDDGTNANLVTGFDACVFSSQINILHCKAAQFTGCEIGAAVAVSNNAVAIFTGNYSFISQTISGTNVVKAGNFNIT
jgi:pectate lyase-like protein